MEKFELKHQKTKSLSIKPNGRSSDFVTPNFILSCNAKCSYCYTYRFGRDKVYINDNIDEILNKVDEHRLTLPIKLPNQTDEKYWTYDICCDTDLAFHWNDYDWDKVLNYFTNTPNIKAVFATKFVNYKLLPYGNDKLRIRFSLMPQNIADIVENSSLITHRIRAVNDFKKARFDVHLNFSPVIIYDNWLKDYEDLFKLVDSMVDPIYKDSVFCEVIFLTHNEFLHNKNLNSGDEKLIKAEELMWVPEIQEDKVSQYGGKNKRYNWVIKKEFIDQFKKLHEEIIPWCKIRYIF
jgi:spore photoproduct lyase